MAFVSADLIADGRSFQFAGQDNASISRVYRVTTNDKHDEPLGLTSSMPVGYGSPHPIYPAYQCLEESWSNEQNGPNLSIWIATFTFKTNTIDQEEQERKDIPDPLDRRARVTVRSVRYGKLIDKDLNGQAFITSAGEPYPAQEIDDERWTITVRKNYTSIPDFIWTYQKKLNASPITVKGQSLEAKTVKFGEVSVPELQIENGVEHYPIEFTLDYKRDGWQLSLLDAGFQFKNADESNKLTECWVYDTDGTTQIPATVAVLLNGSGNMLHLALGRAVNSSDTVYYNDYDIYETADFSVLPLNEG